MDLADQLFGSHGADDGIVLVHAGQGSPGLVAVEGEAVGMDALLMEPLLWPLVDADDGIGGIFFDPGLQGVLIVCGDGQDGKACPARIGEFASFLKPAGEPEFDVVIQSTPEDEAGTEGAAGSDAFYGFEGGVVLVVADKVQRWINHPVADDEAGEGFAEGMHGFWEVGHAGGVHDEQAANGAGVKNLRKLVDGPVGIVGPEAIDAVAEFPGPAFGMAGPGLGGSAPIEDGGIGGDVDHGEGGLVVLLASLT